MQTLSRFTRIPPRRLHALGFVLPALLTLSLAQEPPDTQAPQEDQAAVSLCAFCRTPIAGADFCPRCGRLARLVSTSSEHRFWADAPYVLTFPPLDIVPEIQSEFSPQGLAHETVRYPSGDRYELKMEKKGPAISGKVSWMKGGKETDYTAEMEDGYDAQQRLITRQIMGKLKASSDLYLYRKLDYAYTGNGRLQRIQFTTSFYGNSSDWKKSPAAWLRHSAGQIDLERDGAGALVRIETTIRDGKRSLRGEPEYAEPRLLVEFVVRDGDQIARVSRDKE